MSTVLHGLLRSGLILAPSVELGPRDQSFRQLFVTKEFDQWCAGLPSLRTGSRLLDPAVELHTVFAQFISGAKIVSIVHKIDPPRASGVLVLHTSSFRLAGWAPAPQTLILAVGALVGETHGKKAVRPKKILAREVMALQKALGATDCERGEINVIFRPKG